MRTAGTGPTLPPTCPAPPGARLELVMIVKLPRTLLIVSSLLAGCPAVHADPLKPWLPFGYNGSISVCYDEPCEFYGMSLALQGERRILYPAIGQLAALDVETGQVAPGFRSIEMANLGAPVDATFAQIAVRDDGSIVAAVQSTRDRGLLLGLTADGQPLAGFNRAPGVYRGLVALPGGRFAAYRTDAGGSGEVWRFLADGRPDGDFGPGGHVSAAIEIGMRITSLAPTASGRLLVAGSLPGSTAPGVAGRVAVVLRLLADGTPDPAFGAQGVVTVPFAGLGGEAVEVLPRPDESIALVANAAHDAGGAGVAAVARLDATGHLDPNFGTAGLAWPGAADCSGVDFEAQSATLERSGGIAIAAAGWPLVRGIPVAERRVFNAIAALLGVDAGGGNDGEFGRCGVYRPYGEFGGYRMARVLEHHGDLLVTALYVPSYDYRNFDYEADILRVSHARAASAGNWRTSTWESDTGFSVSIDRVGGDVGRLVLRYSTSDGTASGGREYQPASGSFTWDDGELGSHTLNVAKVATACLEAGATPPSVNLRFESSSVGIDVPAPISLAFTKPLCPLSASSPPTVVPTPPATGGGGGSLDLSLLMAMTAVAAIRLARCDQRRSRSAGGNSISG